MGLTLKGWEKAKSAEVRQSQEFPEFPVGNGIEVKVTELSSKFKDGDPEKVDFMLKLETTGDKPIKGAKFYNCYDRETRNGKNLDGQRDVENLVADVKAMGYDLSEGDGASPEDVMKAISVDQPIMLVNSVKKGNYKPNIYLQKLVRYSNDQNEEPPQDEVEESTTEESVEDQDDSTQEGGFVPEQGMLVVAKPKNCRKEEEYKVVALGEGDCVLKRIRDKEIYEDVTFDRIFREVD